MSSKFYSDWRAPVARKTANLWTCILVPGYRLFQGCLISDCHGSRSVMAPSQPPQMATPVSRTGLSHEAAAASKFAFPSTACAAIRDRPSFALQSGVDFAAVRARELRDLDACVSCKRDPHPTRETNTQDLNISKIAAGLSKLRERSRCLVGAR